MVHLLTSSLHGSSSEDIRFTNILKGQLCLCESLAMAEIKGSSYISQINESQSANVKIAFLNGVLLSVVVVHQGHDLDL